MRDVAVQQSLGRNNKNVGGGVILLLISAAMKMIRYITIRYYDTPVEKMVLGSFGDEMVLCDWVVGHRRRRTDEMVQRALGSTYVEGTSPVLDRCIDELDEYFAGRRRMFDISIRLTGTAFQNRVWTTLSTIPFGHTVSYGALAVRMGMPCGARAVAGAVGANPVSVLVPCHRVIGSNGSLTGYAGGLEVKSKLLELEGIV